MKTAIKAVLFDLDGTLLDTAADLAFALNKLLTANNLITLPFNQIRAVASHGSKGLLKLGFNIDEKHPEYNALKKEFLALYHTNIAIKTCLFSGIAEVLDYLLEQQISWGIVTNKPAWLTSELLTQITLPQSPNCVISGDTVSRAKPFPDPLFYAAKLLQVMPEDCLYIGDAERDIQAGNSAGMTTLLARYGYLSSHDQPETWLADGEVNTPQDIISWLKL